MCVTIQPIRDKLILIIAKRVFISIILPYSLNLRMMNLKMIFREENLDRNDAIVGYVLLYSNLTDMFWLILLHLL